MEKSRVRGEDGGTMSFVAIVSKNMQTWVAKLGRNLRQNITSLIEVIEAGSEVSFHSLSF